MNVKEVFCDNCFKWKKREDLVEARGELYCEECGSVLIRTDDYNPKRERKYTIRAKGIDHRFNWLMRDEQSGKYVFGSPKKTICQLIFTEKELARDDIPYMLYNDAFEVEEVEE
ncbi:hypothetical protein PP262_gp22 [Streptococcus phage vB_SthS_VA460]|uniref:Uncharacterized protein n=1 Tax=Streptococcus phage vB_SthS_VA460 TaxID=2069609 RepID=A0A2I6QR12_9CAUD|nr:hypothetical protein PP262_gp22 [Streptococcus phage vB_SthS_VA460]AUN43427.1 hypothetical protein [Streptococcus phage vB_SthS_VA460]